MNFGSYLNYQHGSTTKNVEFAGPHAFPEGLCVGWTRYTCQSMPAAQPGDLVVHLPDDAVRTDQSGRAHQAVRILLAAHRRAAADRRPLLRRGTLVHVQREDAAAVADRVRRARAGLT